MALPAVKPWLVNLPGDFFTTYRFARGPVLGSGISGDVVLATSLLSPNHKRAVKMMSLLTTDEGLANTILFDREVNILQGLSHPHIIKHTISNRCPDYLTTCAVRYLNDKLRIVHNDIKPDNIFINANNDTVLGDFGLSFFIPPGDTVVCTKDIRGTGCFSAPEIDCYEFVDLYKLDMYSLGVSLWCMMFSAEPILGNMYELLDDPNYFEVAPDTQGWCLYTTMEYDLALRYSTASILAELHEHDIHRDLNDILL